MASSAKAVPSTADSQSVPGRRGVTNTSAADGVEQLDGVADLGEPGREVLDPFLCDGGQGRGAQFGMPVAVVGVRAMTRARSTAQA